jgi:hypothetical protein
MMYRCPPNAASHSKQQKCFLCQCRPSASVHSSARIICSSEREGKIGGEERGRERGREREWVEKRVRGSANHITNEHFWFMWNDSSVSLKDCLYSVTGYIL